MAMLRLARRTGTSDLVRLVVSVRAPDDLYYASELARPGDPGRLHARDTAAASPRPAGRLTADDLGPRRSPTESTAFVCGSPPFCDAATELLTDLEFPVRTHTRRALRRDAASRACRMAPGVERGAASLAPTTA